MVRLKVQIDTASARNNYKYVGLVFHSGKTLISLGVPTRGRFRLCMQQLSALVLDVAGKKLERNKIFGNMLI